MSQSELPARRQLLYDFPINMRSILITGLLVLTSSVHAADLVEVRGRKDVTSTFSPTTRLHLVNLWATWCVPCTAEMPDLQRIDDEFPASQVEVIGVSLDDAIPGPREQRKAIVQKFLNKHKIRFRNLYFVGKPTRAADEYDFDGAIPLTVVYDTSGNELLRHQGEINRAELTQKLRTLLRNQTKEKR